MNFTVERDQLEGLLSRVQGVAERRHTMPVLSHTLLQVEGDSLTLVASDLEIVIRCVLPVQSAEKGAVALPARKFFDIAKVLPKGQVTVSMKEGNFVEITAGRGHFRLSGLAGHEFPEMPEKPKGASVRVDSETFRKIVDKVAAFASGDESRYQLSGILLESREEEGASKLRMVATDGHRLAVADGDVPGISELLTGRKVLVPKKGLQEIRKLAEGGTGSLEISASEKFLFAGRGDTELWVRLLDADFPDYNQVIPRENKIHVRLPCGAFAESIRRVSVMAPEKIHSVRLSFSGKQLEVSTTSPDIGEARDLLPAEFEGQPLRVGFNGRYLLDAINGIGEETVVMELKDDVSQVLIRPAEDRSFLAIVMPMRIF